MPAMIGVLVLWFSTALAEPNASPAVKANEKAPVDQLIPWLLNENHQLRGIPFSEVIFDTTGKRVLPIDRKNETDQRMINQISTVLDQVS